MLNLIIFGAPGSGKGTQSDHLKKHYNLKHISTGDVLREEIRKESEVGKIAKKYIDEGHLVPDELIIRILEKVLYESEHEAGVIFDGFPRTVVQAQALEEMLERHGEKLDVLVNLQVPDEHLVERLIKRGESSGRSDDNETSIKERLHVYHSHTEPVIEYFEQKGLHLPIQGTGEISEIAQNIIVAIKEKLER